MKSIYEIVESNSILKTNKEDVSKILRKLSMATSNLDVAMKSVVNRLHYKTGIDRDLIYLVLEAIPEKSKDKGIKDRYYEILEFHRKVVADSINKKLKEYFESEEFKEIKERKNKTK